MTEFFNANSHRRYPFIFSDNSGGTTSTSSSVSSSASGSAAGVALPDWFIVDFAAVMAMPSGFRHSAGDSVYLSSIHRVGEIITAIFKTTSMFAEDHWVELVWDVDRDYETVRADAEPAIPPTPHTACGEPPYWSAFVVFGDREAALNFLLDGQAVTFSPTDYVVEPARVQSQADAFVRTVTIANRSRTTTTPPTGCVGTLIDPALFISGLCISDVLNFRGGHNCDIRQDLQENGIVFDASIGGGSGTPCGEIPIHVAETSPDFGQYLSGGPACDEIVSSLNGVVAENLQIIGGVGFTVYPHETDPHTVVVDFTQDGLSICDPGAV